MKILFVATVRSHIGQFHMPFIRCLTEAGHEVHAAFKDNSTDKKGLDISSVSKTFEIPFERNPFKFNNIKAYFELKKVIKEGNYDIIHCHTPMGAVLGRLAALPARKKGTKVFYTAHGFHFYNGASKKNWLLFYPVEKLLSKFTDCLILINEEDYRLAINKHFKAEKIVKTHGVGVELSKFHSENGLDKEQVRKQYGFPDDALIMIYPADLSVRKNQKMLLEMLAKTKSEIPKIKLLLPGQPIMLEEYKKYATDLGVSECVEFLGYRRDIPELLAASDIAVSSSRQEGLPINIVEAMAMGKPIVATRVRGNSDLVEEAKGGYLVQLNDSKMMADRILNIYNNKDLALNMGRYNSKYIYKFSTTYVNDEMKKIYKEFNCTFED